MLHKHPPARRFYLASSGIYVQNLIQFGNFWIRSTTTDCSWCSGWAEETSAASNSVSMPHFTDRFDEKF
jgi:hypothetical protein